MISLYRSPVQYDDVAHTYTLGEKDFKGITGMIGRQLFPGKYANVPEYIIAEKASKGKAIHAEIEMFLNGFTVSDVSDEAMAFAMLNLDVLQSEYIVSDEMNFASPIDIVTSDLYLCDIKTTYALDEDYCSWQLSVYAYLFEVQNPDLQVKGLRAIWLKGSTAKVVDIDRISSEEIKKLLDCEIKGEQYQRPKPDIQLSEVALTKLAQAETAIRQIKQQLKQAEEQSKELRAGLLKIMLDAGVKKYESDDIVLSVKAGYERSSLDAERLKSEQPNIYEEFLKITQVEPSLLIKEKKL